MLAITSVIFVVVVVLVAAFIAVKRKTDGSGFLMCVREVKAVAVLGLLLWAGAAAMIAYCFLSPGSVYTTREGESQVCFFLAVSIALGAACMLMYFVRRVVVAEETLTAYGMLGGTTTMRWGAVIKLQPANGRLLMLDAAGAQISVGGSTKSMREFAQIVKTHLRPGVGGQQLDKWLKSIKA